MPAMMAFLKPVTVTTALVALTACSSSTSTTGAPTFGGVLSASSSPSVAELQPVLDTALEQETRVKGFAGSRFSAIPDDRTVNFKGYGGVLLDYDPAISEDILVLGDARVVIDFEAETFGGSVTNMVGLDGSDTSVGVLGTFTYTGGTLGGAQPNNFALDYDIDLTVGPNAVVMNGTMDGLFRGTRADPGDRNPIKAVDATDDTPTITNAPGVNGASVNVIGESYFPTQ